MTAEEFGEWKIWMAKEQQHPAAQRARHAQLLAASMNGAVTRKSGGLFSAAEFFDAIPWESPAQASEPATGPSLSEQVDNINARFD